MNGAQQLQVLSTLPLRRMSILLLARLLIQERWRKLQVQYGWAARLSICLVLAMATWMLASVSVSLVRAATQEQIAEVFNRLLAIWIIAGTVTGKDLTWHVRLDRLLFFPLSFQLLYGSSLFLALLTFPLTLGLCVLEICVLVKSSGPIAWLAALPAFILLVWGARAIISLIRTALFRSGALTRSIRYMLWLLIACMAISIVLLDHYNLSSALPGYHCARIFLGIDPFEHLLPLGIAAALLIAADYIVQHDLVYSGITGPLVFRTSRKTAGRFLLLRPSPSRVLWRISLLGWLRNRNALLLLIWGALYGFGYTYFTKVGGQMYFAGFCWMVLIFHSYLRGNLLGVDNQAAWVYYRLPIRIDDAIRAKNSALSFVQMVMVGGVLLSPVLRETQGMMTPIDWIGILSFACCGILLGEIFGSYFSVLHPEPIERSSLYSGGTTPGAFLVPVLQTVILAILIVPGAVARRNLGDVPAGILFVSVPVVLLVVRNAVLRLWVQRKMIREQEPILAKLMGT